jgi:hypothetical protein
MASLRIAVTYNVVLQQPVARHLLFLSYSPSLMQTCIKILKFKFLKSLKFNRNFEASDDDDDHIGQNM